MPELRRINPEKGDNRTLPAGGSSFLALPIKTINPFTSQPTMVHGKGHKDEPR
jgi:hypothetical protein